MVITLASTKEQHKHGKRAFEGERALSVAAGLARQTHLPASASVMGMMASVLVSLTTVALSSTLAPGCMLSKRSPQPLPTRCR